MGRSKRRRRNHSEVSCCLKYVIFLAMLLLLEMTAGILGFIFKDWIKDQAKSGFQAFIVHYRDDPDQQNLIDWIQEGWLQCCGIEGPTVSLIFKNFILKIILPMINC